MSKLFKSVSVVSGTTLLSRIVGFVRDIVCASIFGTHFGFDAFLVAFKIPNFLRRLFAEGAFSQAFVPVLSQHYLKNSEEDTFLLIDRIFGLLILTTASVVAVVYCIAPYVILIFAPGYARDPQVFALTVSMLKVTFPYLLFISLIAMISAIYNCKQKFFLPAFSPIVLSLCSIVASFIAKYNGGSTMFLAYGVLFAGIIQLLMLLIGMRSFQRLPQPKLALDDKNVKAILKLMGAALFGVSVVQLGLMIQTFLASFLPSGSISWLYYAERLLQLPLALIAIAVATVILPPLARAHAEGDKVAFKNNFEWALQFIIVLSIPAAVGLICLAKQILITLFYHGKFSLFDVDMTAASLIFLACGLPGFMLIKVVVAAFYSRKDITTPVKIAAMALVIDVTLSLLLLKPLAHAGLSVAVSVAAWVNGSSLLYLLLRDKIYYPSSQLIQTIFMSSVAGIIMFIALKLVTSSPEVWVSYSFVYRFSSLIMSMVIGIGAYSVSLFLLGYDWKSLQVIPGDDINSSKLTSTAEA
ncbi:MAG: murein biosynthesis integral membrane protein MurJ [Pseudomonadota bacterium]|nr:murein biosynthesis integral membrane protein MurJ [Pseudomonadota bacterium]